MNAPRTGSRATWLRFAALLFGFWGVMGVCNFQTVYLQEQGYSASLLGAVNAVTSAATIIATPLWGILCDRIRSIKYVFMLTLLAASVMYAFIPAVVGLPALPLPMLLFFMGSLYIFRNPATSLLDTWLVRACSQRSMGYGPIRGLGSLGYTIVGLSIAGLTAAHGTRWTFPIGAMLMAIVLAIAFFTEDARPPKGAKEKKERLNPFALFREYYFTTFLLFAFLIYIVVTCRTGFMPYLLESIGVPGSRFGVVSAYVALVEVPILVAAPALRRRIPLYALSLASALAWGIACTTLGLFADSLISLLLWETFTGIGSGLVIAAMTNYVFTLTPEHLKATGQSIYSAATALAGIAGYLWGGRLLDALGAGRFYLLLGIIGFVSAVYLALTLLIGTKALKRPLPNR